MSASEDNDDDFFEYLNKCPGVLIPCESVEDLQGLIYMLFDSEILDDDTSFLLKNVPDNMTEILNNPGYFDTVEICGIIMDKETAKLLEKNIEDLI